MSNGKLENIGTYNKQAKGRQDWQHYYYPSVTLLLRIKAKIINIIFLKNFNYV